MWRVAHLCGQSSKPIALNVAEIDDDHEKKRESPHNVLWKLLEQWQERAELGNSPRTILDEFAQIQSADIRLPVETGQMLRLRRVIRPEKHQQILLQRLGITVPRRMALPQSIKM